MMKQILLLLMTFELIFSPISFSLINTSQFRVQASDCEEGRYFDETLNRCVIRKEVMDTKNETNQCDGLEGDAYKLCFKNVVDQELSDAEKSKEIGKQTKPGSNKALIPMVVSLGAAYVLFNKKDILAECGSTSAWLMMGAGVATLVGEVLAQKNYKKKLKGMMDEYQERMEAGSEDAEENIDIITSNQTIAFEYQIEQEQARKKAHADREKTYKLAYGLYSAGVLAAVVEQFMYATGETSTCNLSGKASGHYNFTPQNNYTPPMFKKYFYIKDLSAAEKIEIVFRKLTTIFPIAKANEIEIIEIRGQKLQSEAYWKDLEAKGIDQYGDPYDWSQDAAEVVNKTDKSQYGQVENALRTPWVRAALSGVLAVYSKSIADKAGKLEGQASDRIKLLKELRDGFVATGGAGYEVCKDEDRSDPSKVSCYCYTKDGNKNPNRETSSTCQAFWQSATGIAATDYNKSTGYTRQVTRGCLKTDGQYSASCCTEEEEAGKCATVGGKFNLGQMGGLTGLGETMKDTANFINGKMSAEDLNGSKYSNLALAANKNLEKMKKDPKKAPLLKKIAKLQKKMDDGFSARVKKAIASGAVSPTLAFGGLGTPPAPIKSAKDALKSLKDDFSKKTKTKGASVRSNKKRASLSDYDFDSGSNGGIEIDDDLANVMKKDFKLNDINHNSDHNIFKIITNRYHKSGLRRLFKESDISEKDDK